MSHTKIYIAPILKRGLAFLFRVRASSFYYKVSATKWHILQKKWHLYKKIHYFVLQTTKKFVYLHYQTITIIFFQTIFNDERDD